MTAVASETWGLVFWRERGTPQAAIVGPESRTSCAPVPQEASFVGIQFRVGTSLRTTSTLALVDRAISLPDVMSRSFWLDGRRWQTPGVDDAELLVSHLVRDGVLVRDPVVAGLLRGDCSELGDRTAQRRFRVATGLTRGAVAQIERVRTAAGMIVAGAPVHDVVGQLGYYDEPHLARILRRYVGRSARQLRNGTGGAIALDPGQYVTS
jgi:hypothetical protein